MPTPNAATKSGSRRQAPPAAATEAVSISRKAKTKLQKLIALLQRPNGATLPDLMRTTGWQAHSVRGALAGALRKKGFVIDSTKCDGPRRYRVTNEDAV
jgi:hypothetical protein